MYSTAFSVFVFIQHLKFNIQNNVLNSPRVTVFVFTQNLAFNIQNNVFSECIHSTFNIQHSK